MKIDRTTSTARSSPVILKITETDVRVPADVATLVAKMLTAGRTQFARGGARGHTRRQVEESYYEQTVDGCLRIPVGMAESAADHLRQHGYAVRLEDRRLDTQRQRPDLSGVTARHPHLDAIVAKAIVCRRGLVQVTTREDLVERVAALCQLFPRSRIVVVEKNTPLVDDLARRLAVTLCRQVFRGDENFWEHRHRRVVMTPQRAGMLLAADWDAFIAADALAATARGNWDTLGRLGPLRAYGCVPSKWLPTKRERLRVEAVFGRPLVPADLPPRVRVYLVIPPWSPTPPEDFGALARKRTGIWSNAVRNGFIASVAIASSARDELALTDLGFGRGVLLLPVRPRVAILVESAEHARSLLPLLTGWRLLASEPRRSGWGGHDPSVPLYPSAGCDRCIITTLAARRLARLDVDVLIRADGAGSPLRIGAFPEPDRECSQTLLDIADDFDPAVIEDTQSRIESYQARGWEIQTPLRLVSPDSSAGTRGRKTE